MVADFCEISLFDRNILYEDQNKEMFPTFGKIVSMLMEWTNFYRNSGQTIEIL